MKSTTLQKVAFAAALLQAVIIFTHLYWAFEAAKLNARIAAIHARR